MPFFATTSIVAGGASQGPYTVPFPFLESSHLVVTVNAGAATFSIVGSALTLLTPTISGGETITISRVTPRTVPIVDAQDGGLAKADDVDLQSKQLLYIIQEILDAGAGTQGSGLPGVGGLYWDAQSLEIRNVLAATLGTSAVNLTQVNALIAAAIVVGGLPFVAGVWQAAVAAVPKIIQGVDDPVDPTDAVNLQTLQAAVIAASGLPVVGIPNADSFLVVDATGAWATTIPAFARVALDLGTAARIDFGTGLLDVPQLIDVGGGVPGLPAIDGRLLTNVSAPSGKAEVFVRASDSVVPFGVAYTTLWYQGVSVTGRLHIAALQAAGTGQLNNGAPDIVIDDVNDTVTFQTNGTYVVTANIEASLVGAALGMSWAFARSNGSAVALMEGSQIKLAGNHSQTVMVTIAGAPLTYALYGLDHAGSSLCSIVPLNTHLHIRKLT